LNKLAHTNIQFILSGDPDQFNPISNTFRGCNVPEDLLRNSQFLHCLSGGKMLRLNECKRSDAVLFDFFNKVSVHRQNLQDMISEAKCKFPVKAKYCERNLVISHKHRMAINHHLNTMLKPQDSLFIPKVKAPGSTMKPQNMYVWPGLELIACCRSGLKGLRNGVRYKIENIDSEITLEGGVKLSYIDCSKLLRLGYAQTYASCQGDEFDNVRLYDTDHNHFTWKHLYVGMSRAKICCEVM
jgi:hypothetical protein